MSEKESLTYVNNKTAQVDEESDDDVVLVDRKAVDDRHGAHDENKDVAGESDHHQLPRALIGRNRVW